MFSPLTAPIMQAVESPSHSYNPHQLLSGLRLLSLRTKCFESLEVQGTTLTNTLNYTRISESLI